MSDRHHRRPADIPPPPGLADATTRVMLGEEGVERARLARVRAERQARVTYYVALVLLVAIAVVVVAATIAAVRLLV